MIWTTMITAFIRYAAMVAVGILVQRGIFSQEMSGEAIDAVTSVLVPVVITFIVCVWRYIVARNSRTTFFTALSAQPGTPPEVVNEEAKAKMTIPISA